MIAFWVALTLTITSSLTILLCNFYYFGFYFSLFFNSLLWIFSQRHILPPFSIYHFCRIFVAFGDILPQYIFNFHIRWDLRQNHQSNVISPTTSAFCDVWYVFLLLSYKPECINDVTQRTSNHRICDFVFVLFFVLKHILHNP